MPASLSSGVCEAFSVTKKFKHLRWVVHYKGQFVAQDSGEYCFHGVADDIILVRLDGKEVFATPRLVAGSPWFTLKGGQPYPIDILIGDNAGIFCMILTIEERKPKKPYPMRTMHPERIAYPLVQFHSGIPLPEYKFDPKMDFLNVEPAPFSIIFNAK